MPPTPVPVTVAVGPTRLHRFQVVREERDDGRPEDWVVVGFGPDTVELATVDFDWHRTVSLSEVADGGFRPLTAGRVPIWGY